MEFSNVAGGTMSVIWNLHQSFILKYRAMGEDNSLQYLNLRNMKEESIYDNKINSGQIYYLESYSCLSTLTFSKDIENLSIIKYFLLSELI